MYHIHADLVKRLRPDVVITQEQCRICAVTPEDVNEIYLPDISPTPPLHLAYISPTSRLHLAYTSPTSRLCLPYISPTPPR